MRSRADSSSPRRRSRLTSAEYSANSACATGPRRSSPPTNREWWHLTDPDSRWTCDLETGQASRSTRATVGRAQSTASQRRRILTLAQARLDAPTATELALARREQPRPAESNERTESGRRASNPPPQPWEGRALPGELLPLDSQEFSLHAGHHPGPPNIP